MSTALLKASLKKSNVKTLLNLKTLKRYNTIGEHEIKAALRVLKTGVLSGYVGRWNEKFYGGPCVRQIEKQWADYLGVQHAIAVNSATSGLQAAVGALGLSAGDEIIVTPYSMSASAVAPLIYQAVPVFADVNLEDFTLDPQSIRKRITQKTKAILVVHLFGGPAKMDEIMKIASEYRLKVIEDCAQAPGAMYRGRKVGTFGEVGVFSLNCHKTIQTGEGGLCVTNDKEIALRLQLIRNHAETVVSQMNTEEKTKLLRNDLTNLVGFNLRMTEIEAAMGIEQIKKLDQLNKKQIKKCQLLTQLLNRLSCLSLPSTERGSQHVFYVYPMRYDSTVYGVPRAIFAQKLKDRGVPIAEAYVQPLYLLDIFQRQTGFQKENKSCPNVARLYNDELLYLPMTVYDFSENDIRTIAKIFHEVCSELGEKP